MPIYEWDEELNEWNPTGLMDEQCTEWQPWYWNWDDHDTLQRWHIQMSDGSDWNMKILKEQQWT